MTDRTTHLTRLYIVDLFDFHWTADQQTNPVDEELDQRTFALHSVTERLNAFPGWVEVIVSSRMGKKLIQFVRRKSGGKLSQFFAWGIAVTSD